MKFMVGNKTFDTMEEAQKYENELAEKEMKRKELETKKESKRNEIEQLSKVVQYKINSYVKEYGEYPNGINTVFTSTSDEEYDDKWLDKLFDGLNIFK